MHFEIFGPRAEVEPFTLFENAAANLPAFGDPISENWNERYLLLRWNARENRRTPDCDVGKIVFARNAVTIRNIDHPIFAKGDCRTQAGFRSARVTSLPRLKCSSIKKSCGADERPTSHGSSTILGTATVHTTSSINVRTGWPVQNVRSTSQRNLQRQLCWKARATCCVCAKRSP